MLVNAGEGGGRCGDGEMGCQEDQPHFCLSD